MAQFMELHCGDCDLYFELGVSRDISLENLLCIECASTKIEVVSFETESHSRLAKVIKDVEELQKRLEVMTRDEDSKTRN